MPTARASGNSTPEAGLEQQAPESLRRIQAALRTLMTSLPGVTRRPTDLHKTLNISVSLAWQVHRFAHADDPLAEVRNLPGPVAMTRFLSAAARRGAPQADIGRVHDATGDFEALGERHATTRKEFESLLSGLSRHGTESVDYGHRRAAYEAYSHLLGYRADVHAACFIDAPCRDDHLKIDSAMFRTMTGVRRFRNDASIPLATMRLHHDDGSSCDAQMKPIAPPPHQHEYAGLMPEFCTDPLPVATRVSKVSNTVSLELRPSGLGAESAVTCTCGHYISGHLSRYRTPVDLHGLSITQVRTPCKVLIQDVLAYRGLFASTPPSVDTFSDHRDVETTHFDRPCDRLSTQHAAIFMGSGGEAVHVDEIANYPDIVRYALGRMKWNIDDFDVYRVRIEYPLMPSTVFTRFDLREAPES